MKLLWKFFKWLLGIFACILLLDLFIIIFFSFYTPKIEKSDTILILGAAINTPHAYNRSLEGLKVYEQGLGKVIVVSGGQDFKGAKPEANYMEEIIESKAKGVVPIIIEDKSHSTYDNISFTKEKLGGNTGSVIIVSDKFHIARAVLLAKRLGFGPVYFSSPDITNYAWSDILYYYGREMMAMISYIPNFIFG